MPKLHLFSCPFLLILSTFPHISIYFSCSFTSLSAVYLFALVSMETTGLYLHEYHQSSSQPNILELHASNLGSFVRSGMSLNTLWNSIIHSFRTQHNVWLLSLGSTLRFSLCGGQQVTVLKSEAHKTHSELGLRWCPHWGEHCPNGERQDESADPEY